MGWSGEGIWKDKKGQSISSGNYEYGGYVGMHDRREEDLAKKADSSRDEQYGKNKGIASGLDATDNTYLNSTKGNIQSYKTGRDDQYDFITGDIKDLQQQSQDQARDARQTYSNTIRPNQKKLLEQQMTYANDAMSLQEAGDPNNSIHQATRDMYNQQADGVRKQGVADFGVLSSLGAQSAAGQMGNVPMTTGAMSNIYAANQGQAGEAFASAQRRVFDLQQQGIDRGFTESDKQYSRGAQERDRAAQRIGEFEDSDYRQQDQQGRYRGESSGYSNDLYGLGMDRVADDYGLDQGYTDLLRDTQYGKAGRQTAINDQYYGSQQQGLANSMASEGAKHAGQIGMIGAALGAAGSAAGGYYGGMGGAQAGGAIGGAIGGSMAQNNAAPQQRSGYYQQPQGGGYQNNQRYQNYA